MSYTQLYVHLVWATYERARLITPDLEEALWAVIARRCQALDATPIRVGGMPDHVHTLVSPPPSLSITKLVSDLKGGSSHAMAHVIAPGRAFRWQDGYGAFTLRREEVPVVVRYIQDQRRHHGADTVWREWERVARFEEPSRLQAGSQA